MEGEVEEVMGVYCLSGSSLNGVRMNIVSPPSWAGFLQFIGGGRVGGEGTTYACANGGFYRADVNQDGHFLDPDITSGWVQVDHEEDGESCGNIRAL